MIKFRGAQVKGSNGNRGMIEEQMANSQSHWTFPVSFGSIGWTMSGKTLETDCLICLGHIVSRGSHRITGKNVCAWALLVQRDLGDRSRYVLKNEHL